MKASRYNIFVDKQETNETILFNSLYGSQTVLTKEESDLARKILKNPSSSHYKNTSIKSALVQQKCLINDVVDEIEIVRNRKTLGIKDRNRLDLIIMPTLECNFACKYCYEKHHPSKMTDEIEFRLRKWLSAIIPGYKLVIVHWFGGEPLIGYERILSLTAHIADVAQKTEISYEPLAKV